MDLKNNNFELMRDAEHIILEERSHTLFFPSDDVKFEDLEFIQVFEIKSDGLDMVLNSVGIKNFLVQIPCEKFR